MNDPILQAWESEDGGVWYVEGHVPAHLAVLAVVVEQMVDVGADEALDVLVGAKSRRITDQYDAANSLLDSVRYVWFRPEPRDVDAERNVPCAHNDPDAFPFTQVTR